MKVAIYARYSSDNQRDASIADQLRICREFAARQGWTVVAGVHRPRDLRRHPAALRLPGADARRAESAGSMSSSPNRSTASAATRKTPPASSSASPSPA